MRLKIYQIDAFTDKIFGGNPAAICCLESWLDDAVLQNIAMENNLAETAFIVQKNEFFEIRWFTPTVEVDLCGHATLAAAFVIFNFENYNKNEILFSSQRSGLLTVTRQNDWLTLNFPTDVFEETEMPPEIISAFNYQPVEIYKGKTDYLLVFKSETEITKIIPDLSQIRKLKCRGVIVTAKGDQVDFVSRFFAPQSGINEDPVTGSAHTTLVPYWAKKIGRNELTAMQLSERKGYLKCKYLDSRVEISGHGKIYLEGEIHIHQNTN